ncbi:extracellular solute-binding protein [Paenibacillus qinlingensis]|uniref:Aldouronate transport system substrate-binding protein n=1 Tax=Paenibacillus qinlingensis TaxID=1837343 RepID=A0ABU1P111_9BACL|nr:extracellular solute-binding protein [Paenibacillus qinlingensis]MDR6553430.1 putative aldouronate transport system substrate-binding protein [Paenibacillus qinlingensis]
MRNSFKITAITASLISLSLLTTACGGGAANAPATGGQATKAAAGPKPTLKALQIWQKDDYNTYPVAKMLEEKTGYKVQYDMLPQDKPEDKLNLLMSTNEPYDAVTISGTSDSKAQWADYAKRGALVDLTPLIEKYGPNIKKMISQETLDAAKVDGKIYAIPTKANPNTGGGILIRTDWLEKLNMKMPTTLDELTAVLKAFKEKDPGGIGAKLLPMSIRGDLPFVDNIVGAFGMANAWNEDGGKLTPRLLDPAFEKYIAFMNNLYKQKLLDNEFVLNKADNVKQKFSSGQVGIIQAAYSDVPTLIDALTKNIPSGKAQFLSVLKGPDGEMGFPGNAGFSAITFVPKSSKNPEDAVKWLNAKLDSDTFKNMAIGEEGKHYSFKDGAYSPILPIFVDERNAANNYLSGIDEKNYLAYWQARVRKDPRLFEAWEILNLKQPSGSRVIDPLGISPYLAAYSKNNLQLNQLTTDYAVKLIAGGDTISTLEATRQKFKASGGEVSYNEVNEWYKQKK